MTEPYLTGFDYSRPGNAVSHVFKSNVVRRRGSVSAPQRPRRPREKARVDWGYRKRHDIYSLGVVLVEIARWKPIEAVLGIQDRRKVRVKDVIGARDKLLSPAERSYLRSSIGDAASDAIVACLVGLTAFGLADSDSEAEGQVAAKFQMMFYTVVVKPLTDVKF